jgi:gliding motility-associated lipoprotein GldD
MRVVIRFILIIIVFQSCKEQVYNPKPRTYPKVLLPEKNYNNYEPIDCPFDFNIPSYAFYEKDSIFLDTIAGPCWFNINYKEFNAKLFCTYNQISNKESLNKCIQETYRLVKGHLIRADYIDEYPIHKPNKISGIIYEIEGPSATPFQFYLTDSSKHFIRGSLYFNTKINPDSLAPYYEFTKKDVVEMINSFQFKTD